MRCHGCIWWGTVTMFNIINVVTGPTKYGRGTSFPLLTSTVGWYSHTDAHFNVSSSIKLIKMCTSLCQLDKKHLSKIAFHKFYIICYQIVTNIYNIIG